MHVEELNIDVKLEQEVTQRHFDHITYMLYVPLIHEKQKYRFYRYIEMLIESRKIERFYDLLNTNEVLWQYAIKGTQFST